MIRQIGLLVFILLLSFPAFSQKIILNVSMDNRLSDPSSDTVFYDVNRPLTWDDFQGVPDYNNRGGAITASGFAFGANMSTAGRDIYLNVRVYTFFSKKNSWKKPNINSSYHLMHEQHHFDITRISAEKFYYELRNANFTVNNYNKLLSDLFKKAFEENSTLQQQYDTETHHSINTSEQLKWNNKIDREIKSL